ncbi:PREDICTED: LOW QUALITY PROTEIN: putative uncharacterized protein C17orf82 homolog, partial [Galeopterus variegatus]|uniref:Uncharacterized protein n=1 Tax=Galeopterus variegatus TaxID=482537 RepID=A0ABM0RRX3_GALVR
DGPLRDRGSHSEPVFLCSGKDPKPNPASSSSFAVLGLKVRAPAGQAGSAQGPSAPCSRDRAVADGRQTLALNGLVPLSEWAWDCFAPGVPFGLSGGADVLPFIGGAGDPEPTPEAPGPSRRPPLFPAPPPGTARPSRPGVKAELAHPAGSGNSSRGHEMALQARGRAAAG